MAISDTQMLFGTPADADLTADKSNLTVASSIPMIVLAVLAVLFRFLSRWIIRVPFLLDDWLILAALPFALLLPAIDIFGVYQGYFGRHIAVVPDPLGYLKTYLLGLYVYDISYNFAIALAKLSILAIYWRIFHANSFKLPLLVTAGATVAWLISCTLVAIFMCIPVQGFWDKSINATCINNFSFYIGQAACNIVLDIVLLLIPVFRVSKLSISGPQKLAVSGIFLLGAFTTIASALRLNELIRSLYLPFQDPTYELVGSGVWSVIETNLSIICACLPTMRPLVRLVIKGTPYPTSAVPYGTNQSGFSRSESRAKARAVGNWPLPKRMSDMVSPTRSNFGSTYREDVRASPASVSFSRPWDGRADRPFVHGGSNALNAARYHASVTAGGGPEKGGGDIELEDRSGPRAMAYDEVSQYGGSTGTADTDGIKYLQEARPVDGF